MIGTERNRLVKLRNPRNASARTVFLAGTVALTALAALIPALATGAYGPDASATSGVPTVFMKFDKKGPRFVAPKTVATGSMLRVVNQSNPKQIGPHTFSLVTKGSLPKTANARKHCFTKNHICKAIATWHGVKGNGPVKKNPAEAGLEGWDTLGSVSKKGDSWFTGNKAGTSIEQVVSASAGTKLYFLCAIHPEMQASTEVVPAPAAPTS
jgi:hypothetical protein